MLPDTAPLIRSAIDSTLSDVTIGIVRLDHFQLAMPAGEEERARRFYVDLLGFIEVAKPPELVSRGGAWFRRNDIVLHVGVEDDFRAAKKAHPAFRCRQYDAYLRYLSDCGIAVVTDDLLFEGRPHAYVADPFGNRIELIAD